MKFFWIFAVCLVFSVGALASLQTEKYLENLNKWGDKVRNASEAGNEIRALRLDGAEPLFAEQPIELNEVKKILGYDNNEGRPLKVARDNSAETSDYFLNQIAGGKENSRTRHELKQLIQQMSSVQLYVFGTKDESSDSDLEVSTWYLVGRFENDTIVLTHDRVYT